MCKLCTGRLIGNFGGMHLSIEDNASMAYNKNTERKDDEIIFYNGTIITMSQPEQSPVEAIVISKKNGIIIGVGRLDLLKTQFPSAELYNLNSKTLLPGFIDPHQHPFTGSIQTWSEFFLECGYEQCKNKDEVKQKIISETKKPEMKKNGYYYHYMTTSARVGILPCRNLQSGLQTIPYLFTILTCILARVMNKDSGPQTSMKILTITK